MLVLLESNGKLGKHLAFCVVCYMGKLLLEKHSPYQIHFYLVYSIMSVKNICGKLLSNHYSVAYKQHKNEKPCTNSNYINNE